jgi:hypothetical protein
MAPLDGEQMLLEANNKTLTVTTHRVRFADNRGGSARIASIMLDAVSSCEITHSSNRALLLLAVVALLGGFALNSPRDSTPVAIGAVVAVILVAAYFATRKQVLRVASPSSNIDVLLVGMSIEKATEIVDTIEWAKNGRYWLRQPVVPVAPPVRHPQAPYAEQAPSR